MELKVEKQEDRSVIIEVKNESSAFLHLLREELWNDKSVSKAAVIQDHPFISDPKILVEVKSGNPKVSLGKAVDRVKLNIEKFRKAFNKAV